MSEQADRRLMPETGVADKRIRIMEAACRAIARDGARRVRLQDIASEAGVSKGLLHYYAESREKLLAETYEYADARARGRVRTEIAAATDGADQLRRLLYAYFSDDPEVREDWLLWSEFSANAGFDDDLRPRMKRSFTSWLSWLEEIIERAISDGSLVSNRKPSLIALELTAVIDGLGLQMVRGLITPEQARGTLGRALADFRVSRDDDASADGTLLSSDAGLLDLEEHLRNGLRALQRVRRQNEVPGAPVVDVSTPAAKGKASTGNTGHPALKFTDHRAAATGSAPNARKEKWAGPGGDLSERDVTGTAPSPNGTSSLATD
jgi:AcrR family transcriptional regulator